MAGNKLMSGSTGGARCYVRPPLNSRFTWPGLSRDVITHIQSCDTCLRHNKAGNAKAKMVECPTLSEPYESVAVDLVGLLPKGRQGCRFILTYVCLPSGQKLCLCAQGQPQKLQKPC